MTDQLQVGGSVGGVCGEASSSSSGFIATLVASPPASFIKSLPASLTSSSASVSTMSHRVLELSCACSDLFSPAPCVTLTQNSLLRSPEHSRSESPFAVSQFLGPRRGGVTDERKCGEKLRLVRYPAPRRTRADALLGRVNLCTSSAPANDWTRTLDHSIVTHRVAPKKRKYAHVITGHLYKATAQCCCRQTPPRNSPTKVWVTEPNTSLFCTAISWMCNSLSHTHTHTHTHLSTQICHFHFKQTQVWLLWCHCTPKCHLFAIKTENPDQFLYQYAKCQKNEET